jgi:CheY-like chemotaxis protein
VLVRADERLLRVVAQNLVSNAVKFTPKAGRLVLRLGAAAEGLYFSVQDTGIGIAPAQLEKLFQLFQQLDASVARSYGGTGLGLALVKRILHLHGGDVTVQSAPGVGSTFRVQLPRSALAVQPASGRRARERSVLLVDDDPRQRLVLGDFFRRRGFAVRAADRGQDALDALAAAVPGLLVIDVNPPGMDGGALIARIRAQAACAGLPILAITATAEADESARCIAAGADTHLPKPVSLADLWLKTTALTGLTA